MLHQKKCTNGRQFTARFPSKGLFGGFLSCGHCSDLKKLLHNVFQAYFLPMVLVLSIFIISQDAGAADVKLTPKISVGGAYDDNIFLAVDDKVSSSIVTVSPGLEIDYETLLSNFLLTADLDILSYLDESDLDRTNQYYRLRAGHRFKERWDTSADFKYYRDTTLNTYLQETGRVIDRTERDFFEAGGDVAYDLTRISGLTAGYRYQNASYEGNRYSDFDNHNANLYYFHSLKNELDTLTFGPSYYHRSNDFNDVDSFSLDFGWARDWSSIASSNAILGARYTNVKQDDGTENDSWGAKAGFNFTYEGIVSATTFRYFHDIRTTVDGDDINVDNFYLTYLHRITERFRIGIAGRLVFSYKLLDQQADIDDERYYWVEPRCTYRLTENLDIWLKYRYQNNVEFLDDGDQTRERNIVWLELSYGLPILM